MLVGMKELYMIVIISTAISCLQLQINSELIFCLLAFSNNDMSLSGVAALLIGRRVAL